MISALVAVSLVAWFFLNISGAIRDRDIPYGFSFLSREYQTPIGHHFLPYESSDSFLYAFGVAATNTLLVSIVGVILATALGIFVGVSRMSGNWIVSRAALVYIEFFRNVPLLVQLFFWFYIVLALPQVREGHVIAERIYINNSGISIPWPYAPNLDAGLLFIGLAAIAAFSGLTVHRALVRRETLTGVNSYPVALGISAFVLVAAAAWLFVSVAFGEAPFYVSTPEPQGTFGRPVGGFTAPGGLIALLVGLVIYTSSFIAEIVRAGIQSVGRGQSEAARSLGLPYMKTLRHVTFPQALRVIIPPLISQCLNLTKNSSLAAAIGYSDLTNVAVTMTQTAPAVSIFIMIMLAYLAMSLAYSLVGNVYNRLIRFV
ncbi:MAG: ABC transporter permease subunit [Chloroflexota bacterium]|nr:ABC transporter permease subunit [Chloroflexota bacterium]MDE2941603.1 ABC transporter permease subunit [Chloroflexota bacterium]MDE3267222.1 ABC transporter permease subunit [Chloroflexota bacterium]